MPIQTENVITTKTINKSDNGDSLQNWNALIYCQMLGMLKSQDLTSRDQLARVDNARPNHAHQIKHSWTIFCCMEHYTNFS